MKKHSTTTSDLLYVPQKNSIWSYLFWIFLTGVIGFSLFVGIQQRSLKLEKEKLERVLVNLDNEVIKLEKKDGYNRQKALINGQNILKSAQKYRIKWSKIYLDVISLEKNLALFYKIDANKDKKFNISGITNSMDNISKLLIILKNNPKFIDPFVSQISEVKKDDKKTFNFILTFEYTSNTPSKNE